MAAVEAPMRFTVVGLLGEEHLANCSLRFTMRIDQAGELLLEDVRTSPAPRGDSSSCGDILPCRKRRTGSRDDQLPWPGKLVEGESSALTAQVSTCFDTCLGRFEGDVGFQFRRDSGRTWRLNAPPQTGIGLSGLEVSGRWKLEPEFPGRLAVDTE